MLGPFSPCFATIGKTIAATVEIGAAVVAGSTATIVVIIVISFLDFIQLRR